MSPSLRSAALPWIALCALVAGCGPGSASTSPLVIAHRAGTGYWPENSRTAVEGAIARGFKAIEVDLVLTKDAIPVLAHDVSLSPEHCTRTDGTPLGDDEEILIKDLTLAELHRDFVCGGIADPDHPDAEVVAAPHLTFDGMLDRLEAAPGMVVHLDVKWHPEKTLDADTYAEAILGRWEGASLPNPVYATADRADLLRAFRRRMPGLETAVIWPRFDPERSNVLTAVENELGVTFGVQSLGAIILDAEADGIAIAWQVIDRHAVEHLRAEGFTVRTWTVNSPSLLERFCGWPLDGLITDYPEDAPCH